MARTHEGKPFRLLTIIDEYTRECLAVVVGQRLDADALLYRFAQRRNLLHFEGAQTLIERWRQEYNEVSPHNNLRGQVNCSGRN